MWLILGQPLKITQPYDNFSVFGWEWSMPYYKRKSHYLTYDTTHFSLRPCTKHVRMLFFTQKNIVTHTATTDVYFASFGSHSLLSIGVNVDFSLIYCEFTSEAYHHSIYSRCCLGWLHEFWISEQHGLSIRIGDKRCNFFTVGFQSLTPTFYSWPCKQELQTSDARLEFWDEQLNKFREDSSREENLSFDAYIKNKSMALGWLR